MGSSEKSAKMRTLIALSLAISAIAAQAPLPNYMLGDFQLETSEGFEDYMYEIGVNWFTRKVCPDLTKQLSPEQLVFTSFRSPARCTPPLGTPSPLMGRSRSTPGQHLNHQSSSSN